MIVDEPTGGLDPVQRGEVQALLRGLRGERTLLLCTHDLDEARTLARGSGVLNAGRLVAEGEASEVLGGERRAGALSQRRRSRATMTALRALVRKELASLFGAPTAYLALSMVALVTALIFFDHLRLYNQILFVYASATMGGFASDSVPDYVNLWDSVFFPVMETLGLTLIGIVPLDHDAGLRRGARARHRRAAAHDPPHAGSDRARQVRRRPISSSR